MRAVEADDQNAPPPPPPPPKIDVLPRLQRLMMGGAVFDQLGLALPLYFIVHEKQRMHETNEISGVCCNLRNEAAGCTRVRQAGKSKKHYYRDFL